MEPLVLIDILEVAAHICELYELKIIAPQTHLLTLFAEFIIETLLLSFILLPVPKIVDDSPLP
jgi:hypothetical protein